MTTPCQKLEKYPGAELLPGYRLIRMLGRGGFGEVWKCEAPGRLHKAVKFVASGSNQYRQELAAFEQVRTIRHPYLLSLERVELIAGELVMVMELADCQIQDLFHRYQAEGHPGIPRLELLGYLEEAAEALDMMCERHQLQHLDVKPENLFLVAGHLKIGDYGLVRSMERFRSAGEQHGFTPRYAAPEVLEGRVDNRSDQYSLALVYAELLTGKFPYSGATAERLLYQHLNNTPDLSSLPRGDRAAVARALSKDPRERFPSCLNFVAELLRPLADPNDRILPDSEATAATSVEPASGTDTVTNRALCADTPDLKLDAIPSPPPETPLPPLPPSPSQPIRTPPARRARNRIEATPSKPVTPAVISLDQVNGMPVHAARKATISRSDLIETIVREAALRLPGIQALDSLPETAQTCWFISTLPAALVPLKLALLIEQFRLTLTQHDSDKLILVWEAPPLRTKNGAPPQPRGGMQFVIHRPTSTSADYFALGSPTGTPDEEVFRYVQETIPAVLDQIRAQLQNLEERRKHPRFPAKFPIRVYPHYSDGMLGQPIAGQCRDVSAGGLRFFTNAPVLTERAYVVFQEPASITDSAILVHRIRSTPDTAEPGYLTSIRFRLE